MATLRQKLQHRDGTPALVLWAPAEVEDELAGWVDAGATVHRRMRGGSPFVLAFVRTRAEVDRHAARLASLLGGTDDPILWVAYPKKSSKRYASDVGRDDSWQPLGDLGFEPVRQVAVDADWSALRFRKVEKVATLTRSRAISAGGRRRLAAAKSDPAVEAFVAARPELEPVHRLIRDEAPELVPSFDGASSVGYGPFHYVYDSGREGDAHRLVLRQNARYTSLYVLAGDDAGYFAEQRAVTLGKVDVGRSCVRYTKAAGLDLDGLRALVRLAADQHAREASTARS